MIQQRTNALMIVIFLFFISCKKENRCDCIKRTGTIIKEQRLVSEFNGIATYDNVNVFITEDSVFEIIAEGGKNILPLIETKVENNMLIIHNNNVCNWTRSYDKPLNIYIKMPAIEYLTSNGSGKVTSLNTITSNTLTIETNGAGDIELWVSNDKLLSHINNLGDVTLHGSTTSHVCAIGGNAFLYSQDLITNTTWLQSFTTGICYVNVISIFDYQIGDIGDIYCYSKPTYFTNKGTGVSEGQLYFK